MKRIIFFILLPFLCLADGMTVQQFNRLKSDIIDELSTVSRSYSDVVYDMNIVYEHGLAEYQTITQLASQYPDSDIYQGQVSGAQAMMVYFNDFEYLRNEMQSNISRLGNAINMVNSLSAPSNSVVDLSPVIAAINSNTYHIVSSVNTGVHDITNSIALNIAHVLGRADVAISNLHVIVEILQNANLSGGGGSSGGSTDVSTIEDLLDDIISYLSDILDTSSQISTDVGSIASFVEWCYDEENPFRKYLDLAHSRLDSPDVSLSADLSLMWQYCLEQISNIVFKSDGFPLTSQIYPVVSDSHVHLSNEGLIGLQNLAMNQRQYLCSVAMLNELKGLNSTNNLAWVTNYLGSVQSHFYSDFNLLPPKSGNYYQPNVLTSYTNFVRVAQSGVNPLFRFGNYVSNQSNWFARIEMQLMTLNGLFPLAHEGLDDFEDATSDEENNDRLVRYSTNDLASAAASIAGVSNTVSGVLSRYTSLIGNIWPDNLDTLSEVTIMPSIDFGGIQMNHIHLAYSDIESVGDAIRLVCQCLYWFFGTMFAFSCFRWLLKVLGQLVLGIQKLLGLVLS